MKNKLMLVALNSRMTKLGFTLLLTLPLLPACSMLLAKQPLNTVYYALDANQPVNVAVTTTSPRAAKPAVSIRKLPTLIIYAPKSTAGYDTRHMMYSQKTNQIAYFARSEWVATPSSMLQPLMVASIEKTGAFSAVFMQQSVAVSDFRLESEVIKLLQDFTTKPSHVQLVLRATMIDNNTNKVLAVREFDERMTAAIDNPAGGAAAAYSVVNVTLQKLSEFASSTVSQF